MLKQQNDKKRRKKPSKGQEEEKQCIYNWSLEGEQWSKEDRNRNSKSVLSQVTGLTPVNKGSVRLEILTPKQSTKYIIDLWI